MFFWRRNIPCWGTWRGFHQNLISLRLPHCLSLNYNLFSLDAITFCQILSVNYPSTPSFSHLEYSPVVVPNSVFLTFFTKCEWFLGNCQLKSVSIYLFKVSNWIFVSLLLIFKRFHCSRVSIVKTDWGITEYLYWLSL